MDDDGQLSFDPISMKEGERLRDEGIALVRSHTADEWQRYFERYGAFLLHSGRRRITSEDIVSQIGLPPGSRNAIGAAMRGFALKYNLRNVGTVKAARTARHAGRITVWERI